ncbi:protein LYK2 [Malania oleifera]|uniref:protein LYK2 n=1 Tax=Malania oleifera TaxID=397392 RepID=UPI0025ADE579|nr:protein LYK2 [Malania oleifera]
MGKAALISMLHLVSFVFSVWVFIPAFGQNWLGCETAFTDASGYRCNGNGLQDHCKTFAMLRTNSYYSSLSNLSLYLGINRLAIAEANGFSVETEFLPKDQLLLIPIDCRCNGSFFGAELTKTTIKGESFNVIAESLEGLTTCRAIQEKNPSVPNFGLGDKVQLLIPLKCACPSSSELSKGTKFLVSYPVRVDDTVSNLASEFNTTPEAVISANNRSVKSFQPGSLVSVSSLLIPLCNKPTFNPLAKPREPNSGFPTPNIPVISPHKKKSKKRKTGIYVALIGVAVGAGIAIAAVFLIIHWKRKKQNSWKTGEMDLQQLGLSVRTTSDKKVSFEASQDHHLNGQIMDSTPHKILVETYTLLELKRATEDFSSTNHIDGTVFHGRLNGQNLAIKRVPPEIVPKINFRLFHDSVHHHPNIVRLLGTCLNEGPDSYLVFDYAKNGSLKDWLHGGLAMKSQFISSCYCFLTWSQRLRICLDVALVLQFMHHIMNTTYVHRNIKTRNIFLDEEFNAKVGNFGMARCVKDNAEEAWSCSTESASWDIGYLAPEIHHQGKTAPSIDIFAYGVVLLEVLSAQPPITKDNMSGEGGVWLPEKIRSILQSENPEDLREWMDDALGDNYSSDAAIALANLAKACVEKDPSSRPSAREIVEKLSRLVEELPEVEHSSVCESSCKPLVIKAAANSM